MNKTKLRTICYLQTKRKLRNAAAQVIIAEAQDSWSFCAPLFSHKDKQHKNQDTHFKFNNPPIRAGQH